MTEEAAKNRICKLRIPQDAKVALLRLYRRARAWLKPS
jgi:hypothetical protein